MLPDLTDKDFERWPNFKRAEFACKGSGQCCMDPEFMDLLQKLRAICGFPFTITSGYRSPEHNASVSKTGVDGPHTFGKAADIAVARGDAYKLIRYATDLGFTGIGVSQQGNGRFIHVDTLSAQEAAPGPRPTVWSY